MGDKFAFYRAGAKQRRQPGWVNAGVIDPNHYAMDYLLTEVLKRLPESTQAFLIETAVLDQL